jgi:hypothetical protein
MDYSQDLFSYKGDEPCLLPSRIRLSNKETRYSFCVTLDELTSEGYIGPIEVPNITENQYLCWCCNTLQYLVVDGVDPHCKRCPSDNAEAKALLLSRIKNSPDSFDKENKYTQTFKEKVGHYKGKLLDLYFKSDLNELSISDIPSQPMVHSSTVAAAEITISGLVDAYREEYKWQYENYGVIPNLDPRLAGCSALPEADWVRGSGLLYDSANDKIIVFGRHCIS